MRIYITKWFSKFSKKENISHSKLIEDIKKGNIDVNYGGGVIKQRISRADSGKSGSYRSIILYKQGDKAFFVYGFLKKNRANIDKNEIKEFKNLAKLIFSFSDKELEKLINAESYIEVK